MSLYQGDSIKVTIVNSDTPVELTGDFAGLIAAVEALTTAVDTLTTAVGDLETAVEANTTALTS